MQYIIAVETLKVLHDRAPRYLGPLVAVAAVRVNTQKTPKFGEIRTQTNVEKCAYCKPKRILYSLMLMKVYPPCSSSLINIYAYISSRRISNRIGRPIRFRIEFSNRIGRIYHTYTISVFILYLSRTRVMHATEYLLFISIQF